MDANSLSLLVNSAHKNATELVEESQLLLDNGHRARAYFLAVAAVEEVGKAFIAFRAQGQNLKDPAVVARVRGLINDHPSKITSAFTGFLREVPTEKNIETSMQLISALRYGREPSMYTDLSADGSMSIPEAVVGDRQAADCLRLARNCVLSFADFSSKYSPENLSTVQNQVFALSTRETMKVVGISDFWWFYIDQKRQGVDDWAAAIMKYRNEYLLKSKLFDPSR